jgi:CheY-like chemotaxis protein
MRPAPNSISCPKCGWSRVRRSERSGVLDKAAGLLFLVPLRCRTCRLRFYRPWFIARRALPVIERAIPMAAPVPSSVFVSSLVPATAIRPRILLLDDDPSLRKLLRRLLDKEGYEVREASDSDAALAELRGTKIDLAVVNLDEAEQGETAVRALRSACAELTIVLWSEAAGLREGSENLLILPRPSRPFTVVSVIAQALGSCRLPA